MGENMKKVKRNAVRRFTLAEILVAMAVFSILLTLMVQFFSSARTLWTANEKRTAVYADASIAMDLMSMLLQTTFYTEGGTPFEITNAPASSSAARPGSGWNSNLMFVSKSGMDLDGGAVRYLRFQRGPAASPPAVDLTNVLQLRIFCDDDTGFPQCFQPFGVDVGENESGARSFIQNFLNGAPASRVKPILRNVTGLKFLPVDCNGEAVYGATCTRTPAGIEIELSLMPDEAAAREWAAMAAGTDKDNFRTKNEYTFRRTVWLGDRTFTR